MFKNLMQGNINIVTKRPKLVILTALLLTLVAILLATQLNIELNWVALAPQGHPAVAEYDKIIKEFPALNNVIILVESEDTLKMQEAVIALDEAMLKHDQYILSMTSGLDQDFILDYGLLLAEESEATGLAYALSDNNLDSFVMMMNTYLSKESSDEYTLNAINQLFKAVSLGDASTIKSSLRNFYSGNTLMMSENGKMTMLMLQPTFDIMNLEMIGPGVGIIEETIEEISMKFPTVEMAATGMHVVARDETASIQSDSSLTTVLALTLILMILYLAFRSFSAPILAFLPLVVGIIWTVGLTQLVIGRLNMMTAFSAAMLIGLGIDYSIHMYSSYTERRSKGLEKLIALDHAISISGPGIITGALTTAVAFFALNISKLELLSELGTVMGLGIICTLISVFWILPALIVLKKEKTVKIEKVKGQFKWIGRVAISVRKYKVVVLLILLLSTLFMANEARQIEFDLNLLNLEPENLESIELMNYMVEEYDMSADSFSVVLESLDEVYAHQKAYEALDGIKEVVSVAALIPEKELQNKRIESLDFIKSLPDSIQRPIDVSWLLSQVNGLDVESDALQIWIDDIELNGLNENSVHVFYEEMTLISEQMLSLKTLTPEYLPKSFKEQYVSKDGEKYLVTIYPNFDIWSNLTTEKGEKFFNDLYKVNENITGTPIFMKVLYESASEEMLTIASLLLAILFIILMIHFRSIQYTVYAIVPLLLTMIFTVGTMHLIDLKFNIMNFLSILLIIGIGIDDGVHILHHYKTGVKKIEYLFSSVGRAILLTTLTTVCGFGSLIFSSYRGIASLGAALSIGVLYAFLMSIVILPILLKEKA